MDHFEDIGISNLLARVNKIDPFYIFANTHVTNDRLVFFTVYHVFIDYLKRRRISDVAFTILRIATILPYTNITN